MRRLLTLLLVSLPGLAGSADEPVDLVRGTDPAQFELVGISPASIAIAEGEVRLTGKPLGYFATRPSHRDYELTFEYRYDRPEGLKSDADFRGNGGVLLHISGSSKVWPACVQVQLAQADPGAVFAMGEARCEVAPIDPRVQKATVKPVGDWNQVRITCRGASIAVALNGVEIARAGKVEPASGAIGWQSEGKPIRFREIKMTRLP
jgi:hypothetical protein